jgi:hypothetical protein
MQDDAVNFLGQLIKRPVEKGSEIISIWALDGTMAKK